MLEMAETMMTADSLRPRRKRDSDCSGRSEMKRLETVWNRKATLVPHVVRGFAVIVTLLFSSCAVTKMNVMLDLRSSTLAFDTSDAHPEFDVVWD
jgi:hypothetical protein